MSAECSGAGLVVTGCDRASVMGLSSAGPAPGSLRTGNQVPALFAMEPGPRWALDGEQTREAAASTSWRSTVYRGTSWKERAGRRSTHS